MNVEVVSWSAPPEVGMAMSSRRREAPAASLAFEVLYQQEYAAVVALAYALCGRSGPAEDLAQEAFLVAHQRWARVGGYERPGAFVRRVVVNMAISYGRRRASEARALSRLAGGRPDVTVLEPADADFWHAVRRLGGRQAQVLALYYLEDRPADDIGEILGCSSATVRVHLHRGRQALQAMFGERGLG
jgi:RNA polymerase sigma factor (sigma-70 family)